MLADVLNLDEKLENRYDLFMSFGLAEHFRGEERRKVIKALFWIARAGYALILVLKKWNLGLPHGKLFGNSSHA